MNNFIKYNESISKLETIILILNILSIICEKILVLLLDFVRINNCFYSGQIFD